MVFSADERVTRNSGRSVSVIVRFAWLSAKCALRFTAEDVKGPTGTGHISSISLQPRAFASDVPQRACSPAALFFGSGPTLVKKSEAAEIQLDGPEKTKGRATRQANRPAKARVLAAGSCQESP